MNEDNGYKIHFSDPINFTYYPSNDGEQKVLDEICFRNYSDSSEAMDYAIGRLKRKGIEENIVSSYNTHMKNIKKKTIFDGSIALLSTIGLYFVSKETPQIIKYVGYAGMFCSFGFACFEAKKYYDISKLSKIFDPIINQ